MRLALVMALLLCLPSLAHAVITQHIVVVVGVKLTPDQAKVAYKKQAELAKAGLELFDDPSMFHGNPPPKFTTYIGKRLAMTQLDRNKPTAAITQVPTTADLDAVKKLLGAHKLPQDVQLITLVVSSGGK